MDTRLKKDKAEKLGWSDKEIFNFEKAMESEKNFQRAKVGFRSIAR